MSEQITLIPRPQQIGVAGRGLFGLRLAQRVTTAGLLSLSCMAFAQASGGSIYSCINASGKKITSDRAIPECAFRDQFLLNSDGSVRSLVVPTLTPEERLEKDAKDREAVLASAIYRDAVRRDRNLTARFPDEAAHRQARTAALDSLQNALRSAEERLILLAKERKPLVDEAEFYNAKTIPGQLKAQIEGNSVSADALRTLIQNQQIETVRINKLYDAELARLKQLWRGAAPGSLGPILAGDANSAAPTSAALK
jgi:hypothetical protein